MTLPRILSTLALLAALPAAAQEGDSVDLRIMSFNIWYGGEQVDFHQVIATILAADADIVGLQEPDGNTARIAELAGYPYVDLRRHIISRVPLFDSGLGQRTETGQTTYAMAALDSDAAHAWAMVAPGRVIALANLHLTSDPYGPNVARDGGMLDEILQTETDTRLAEITPLLAALQPVVDAGVPTVVTGDFNTPSHLDWTEARVGSLPQITMSVPWPVTLAMEVAGFSDTFRAAHPDPVARPGLTYSPGFPHPAQQDGEVFDRIDYVFAAHAHTLASEVLGEAGNPDVDKAIMPWPSDHRAVVSTVSVIPVTAPALIAVEPRLVTAGNTFLVRVNSPDRADWSVAIVPRGGDPATDTVTGVEDIVAYWRPSVKFGTYGLAPGAYDAVMLAADSTEIARTMFSVIPEDGRATVMVLTPRVAEGDGVTVAWSGAMGYRFDWLGIYAAGEASVYNYLAFAYTGATLEGEMTLTPDMYFADLTPGDYEVRLLVDDHYVTVATAPFTVTAD
jgi:endonuclease/exonuclease/phosphatase family metal-dependent hydrolase